MSEVTSDIAYMQRALELATQGRGWTSPNPMVGAVLVRDGQVIAEGYHRAAGQPHAEVEALRAAGPLAQGATLYVTLEPCCHFGRTPPCTRALIQAGIRRVVCAMLDPNPLVQGKGVTKLWEAGIEVTVGVLADQAQRLNEAFIKWITTRRPFVILKAAISLDGKIAASSGSSRWITAETSRLKAHELRSYYDAVLVGVQTVVKDDPQLTCRLEGKWHQPVRIVVDSRLRLPLDAQIINPRLQKVSATIIAHGGDYDCHKAEVLKGLGVETLELKMTARGVDLEQLMEVLGQRGITSVLIEGGAEVNASALEQGIVDKVVLFVAPKLIGGHKAPGMIGGKGIEDVNLAPSLHDLEIERVGPDLMITGYL